MKGVKGDIQDIEQILEALINEVKELNNRVSLLEDLKYEVKNNVVNE